MTRRDEKREAAKSALEQLLSMTIEEVDWGIYQSRFAAMYNLVQTWRSEEGWKEALSSKSDEEQKDEPRLST